MDIGLFYVLPACAQSDEVDKELEKRGHKFCRYADDSNIYVKSKKVGFSFYFSEKGVEIRYI